MDTNIRTLLTTSRNLGVERGLDSLKEAFTLMKNVAENRSSIDTPDPFGQDLYVVCAEIAFQHSQADMAKDSLKMYFMRTPATNQFLCRAYLCQAQLLAPSSAEFPEQLERAVVYLVKAINMAKENSRYHFLVYNASVIYWQFSRPFLKPKYRQVLAPSLHQVVKALDDIEDKDYEWRAQLMIALIECHMDAGRKSDASHIATAALSFIKSNVPHLFKQAFGLMIKFQLVESSKFQKDMRTAPELNIYYRICKLKLAIEQREGDRDPEEEMCKILSALSNREYKPERPERPGVVKEGKNRSRSPRSGTPDESSISETEEKADNGTGSDEDSNADGRSPVRGSRNTQRSPTPTMGRKMQADNPDKPHLLLELCRLALEQNLATVADHCVNLIKDCVHLVNDPGFFLEVEFLQSELLVKALGEKRESYQKAIVDIRQQAIKRCDEALTNAVRLGNPNVIQAGCVTQWNLCLPLLQSNLRQSVRRPLTTVAEALENIHSLLMQLRCQVHIELAKCEEDIEQIQQAILHLNKALSLDDGHVYRERINVLLHRLELRGELYNQPDSPEDQAGMIIEQARKSASGTMRMKRSLLVRAGQALAPDAFTLVLESENFDKAAAKGSQNVLKELSGKAQTFSNNVKKAEGHLRRLGNENDKMRAHLWGDLARTARKQEVWDVARVAARFCLLYDDDRWRADPPIKEKKSRRNIKESDEGSDGGTGGTGATGEGIQREKTFASSKDAGGGDTGDPTTVLYERDLVRMMAEVNFINGEALIHLLRSEGVELGDVPDPPEDKRKRPKGYVAKKPEDDPDWIAYVEWIRGLTDAATACFLRACSLGQNLGESWVVCSAAAYLWNYNNRRIQHERHSELVDSLQNLLDALKKVGHSGQTNLLVDICTSLANGLLQPWLPAETPREKVVQTSLGGPGGGGAGPEDGKASPKRAKPQAAPNAAAAAGKSSSKPTVSIAPEGQTDIKRAIEVCEYAMRVTNGDRAHDVVAIGVRLLLLQTWVRAKQMKAEQLGKGLGTENENDNEGQKPLTRAMVAVEMHWLNYNGLMEFKECPQLANVCEMISTSTWPDRLVELQLWTRLTSVAFQHLSDHALVTLCAKKALQFADTGTQSRAKRVDPHKYMVEQEMLSYAACLYGQSLVLNTQGKNAVRRSAMQQFLASARFGRNANNYDLVMTASRHYWNASLPLINQPIERELLVEPISLLLECVAGVTGKDRFKKPEDEEEETEGQEGVPPVMPDDLKLEDAPADVDVLLQEAQPEKSSLATGIIGGPDDDLTLRASLYGVLFHSYADRGEWNAGLRAMDQAIADMPRTNHRLLIFKHLVVVKAKLGLNVGMSIQKFKDESEDYVAHMWRRVALCSKQQLEQLQGYQNAIEALNSPTNEWQKFDYLLELGQWLCCNEFPLRDALDQVRWAVDILLNMKFQVLQKEEKKGKGKGGKKSAGKEKKGAGGGKAPAAGKGAAPSPAKKQAAGAKDKGDAGKKATAEGPAAGKSAAAAEKKELTAVEQHKQLGIPVKKEIVIGVLRSNEQLQLWELSGVRQLEGLFRAHVLLAQIAGRNSPDFTHYVLQAVAYVMQIWQVSVSQSGNIVRELAKLALLKEAEGGKEAKGSAKKGKKGKEEAPVKEKPKRKGPLDAVPSTVEHWAEYDAPEEVLEAFRTEQMRHCGVNASTFVKPSLTLFYLEQLVDQVRQLGYNHLALPLLALMDVLARDLLKHRPLFALVHLRAMEVCLELNLQSGVAFHQKLAEYNMTKDEQAKSQEEMAVWKERQVQVAKEERRIKESLSELRSRECGAQLSDKERELQAKLRKSQFGKSAQQDDDDQTVHLGRKIGAIEFRHVWTDTAQVLLDNALYQPARELLNEALQAARAFEEKELQARVLHLLARLSYYEGQYLQAVTLCNKAQHTYDGDELFWFETSLLMVEATLSDYELKRKDRFRKARAILVHALNVFTRVAETRPNKTSITGYVLARLEAKLGSVQVQIADAEHDNILKEKVCNALISATNKLEHAAEHLLRLGFKREAVRFMRERVAVFTRIARQCAINGASTGGGKQRQHEYLLKALGVLREAVGVARDVYTDSLTMLPIGELRAVSTPVQRECAAVELECAELLVDMYELHTEELRMRQLQNLRKGSIVRALEEYVEEAPTFDTEPVAREWLETCKSLFDEAMTLLESTHSQSGSIVELRSKTLYNTGKLLRLHAEHKHPDPPKHWNILDMPMLVVKELNTSTAQLKGSTQSLSKQNTSVGDNRTERTQESEEDEEEDSRMRRKQQQQLQLLQRKVEVAERYLAQASEVLTQALNLSLDHNLTETAGLAALQLVECIGQLDPGLSSQYLCLYQSCAASQYLEGLLRTALVDPSTSQQAALFHQRANLLKDCITSNRQNGPVMAHVIAALQQTSTAWKRLQVQRDHVDLLKDMQPNYNFIVLQHSPDKRNLYGAVLDKPTPAAAAMDKKGGGGGAKNALKNSKARIIRVDTGPTQLDEIMSRFYWYKHEVMQFLLKMEYQRSMFAQRERMLANLDDKDRPTTAGADEGAAGQGVGHSNPLEEDWAQDEKRLHGEFLSLLTAMEDYLGPITGHIDTILRPTSPTVSSEGKKEGKGGRAANAAAGTEPELPNEYALLLADPSLLEMPLEALKALHHNSIASMTRDVSFQLFFHKSHVEVKDTNEDGDNGKKAKDKNAPLSRIPGARELAKTKLGKSIPLDRPVPPGMLPVDTHQFRYIVDAHLDCAETEEHKPIEQFKVMLEEHEQQLTPRWLGVYGAEHSASVGEYEIYIKESSAAVFYGMESLLTQLPPYKVASVSFTECQLMMLYDRMQTNRSYARQSKLDVLKTQDVLTLEKPVETAMLLSLSGINAIFSNQWHCTTAENANKLHLTMRDILSKGKTSGQTARLLQDPVRRMYEVKAEEEAAEKEREAKAAAKPGAKAAAGSAKGTPAQTPGANGEVEEEEQEEERPPTPEPTMNRSWYNMVCYGLPNLIVTQLTKA